ncbi:esterase-like [Gossypium australe]|uniref:Esterase-like n=1 Tax=Gossypium australe TaxID=47621 RepID=A0A5B6VCJ4_9ROSI|nr:esterase-like [Gossypium australe]
MAKNEPTGSSGKGTSVLEVLCSNPCVSVVKLIKGRFRSLKPLWGLNFLGFTIFRLKVLVVSGAFLHQFDTRVICIYWRKCSEMQIMPNIWQHSCIIYDMCCTSTAWPDSASVIHGVRQIGAAKDSTAVNRSARDDALSQAMLRILERVAGPNSRSGGRGSVTERLWSNGAELSRGVTRVALNVVEYWLEATERIMDDLDYTPEQKLKGAVSLLSYYARGMVASEYERCVRFEDGLRDNLRVLIAPYREREFSALVEKAKIAEDVKRSEHQNRDRERGKNKRDSEPSSNLQRLKKKARSDGPVRVRAFVAFVAPTGLQPCVYCGRRHLDEC